MSDLTTQNAQGSAFTSSGEHEDRIEKLQWPFYIRWTRGPDYERAYLCIDDDDADMLDFAEVSFKRADLFAAGLLALDARQRIIAERDATTQGEQDP